ncbi:MAG: flagellar export chaperone FliS [Candidatus Gastranaerophilales bacterium]|nr:flagellar export chaperone FliS [Candidatus Gastranaerophilales bacterium]
MSTVNPYLKQYKKNQVETATPEKLLILLYDGAIQFLNKAKHGLNIGDLGLFHHSLVSCEKIIIEFMNSLDMERGGKFAQNLYELYSYYYKTLVDAGISKNLTKVEEVLHHLTGLRDTWLKAIEIASAEKGANLLDDEPEDDSRDTHIVEDKYVKAENEEDDYEEDDDYDEDEEDDEDL